MADRDQTAIGRWSATAVVRSSSDGHPRQIRLDDGAGGAASIFPHVWLRNNCPCPSCTSHESGFRKQVIRDFPFHSVPVDFKVSRDLNKNKHVTPTNTFQVFQLAYKMSGKTLWRLICMNISLFNFDNICQILKLHSNTFENLVFILHLTDYCWSVECWVFRRHMLYLQAVDNTMWFCINVHRLLYTNKLWSKKYL